MTDTMQARFEGVTCRSETDEAILVVLEGDQEHWIPRSQVARSSEVNHRGDEGALVVSGWFARKEGLPGCLAGGEPERSYDWGRDIAPRLSGEIAEYRPDRGYCEGSLLRHRVFGAGMVTRVEGPRMVVQFKGATKKLVHQPAARKPPRPVGGGHTQGCLCAACDLETAVADQDRAERLEAWAERKAERAAQDAEAEQAEQER